MRIRARLAMVAGLTLILSLLAPGAATAVGAPPRELVFTAELLEEVAVTTPASVQYGPSTVMIDSPAIGRPAASVGYVPPDEVDPRVQTPALAASGTGAVSIKGPSSELLPGVTVEIRKNTCEGPAVWYTTTTSRPDAYGAFGIGLEAGEYCIKTLAVPAPYWLPADVVFTMEARPANWVTVWVPGPLPKVVVTGALVAKNGSGVPINGVTARIREGSCASNGQGVWQNTTAANRWAEGGFGISLSAGAHCVTTLSVPVGYQTPVPFDVTVTNPSPYWLTVWVPGSGPSNPGSPAPYYANCAAVRAAGAAPIRAGQPGYGRHLDRDGDGVGCEN